MITAHAWQVWHRLLWGLVVCTLPACATLQTVDPARSVARASYQQHTTTLSSASGCQYQVNYKQPHTTQVAFTVVLGHGFLRSQHYLHDLSNAIADAGIPVITLDFCAMRPWNGNHQFNAVAMRAVADHYDVKAVVFAGHSAGALAAVLAAAEHPHTLGMVLMDYVDHPPLGADALQQINIPAVALFGEPSACNAHAIAVQSLIDRNNTIVEHFPTASHCAFESPTNPMCRWLCARGKADESQVQRHIIERTVNALIGFRVQAT